MVRAIVRNGTIEPLTPLPADWSDGYRLVIAEATEQTTIEAEADGWARQVEAAMDEISPEDHDLFEAAMAKQEKESKELVRRQWGLDR